MCCTTGMVSAMDEGIGNLTKVYKELGLWDDTLIVFSTGKTMLGKCLYQVFCGFRTAAVQMYLL